MPTKWLPTLAFLTALIGGCITAPEAVPLEPELEPASDEPVDDALPQPGCKSHRQNSNYGVSLWFGGVAYSYDDGNGQRVYVDDNGVGGLQTEETCPTNPDTRIA